MSLFPFRSILSSCVPGPGFLVASLLVSPALLGAQSSVVGWEVAGTYPAIQVPRNAYPNFYSVFLAPWKSVDVEPEGFVDLNLHLPRENPSGDLALARTTW